MQEVRHDGIRVAYVLPGSVNTGVRRPLARTRIEWTLPPEDVAQVVIGSARPPVAQPAEPRRDPPGAAAAEGLTCPPSTSTATQLELHETMMGPSRGRLAVALDLLTDALAMVGQHGVYCQSTRHARPADAGHRARARADRRRQGAAAERDRARAQATMSVTVADATRRRRALQPARAARARRPRRAVPRPRHARRAHGRRSACFPPDFAAGRREPRVRARQGARASSACRTPTSRRCSTPASTTAASIWCSSSSRDSRCAPRWPGGR